jgi:hypothetical protein
MLGIKPANVAFRTGCTIYLVIYLDAKQLLSASIDRVRNNRTTKNLKLAARVKSRAQCGI